MAIRWRDSFLCNRKPKRYKFTDYKTFGKTDPKTRKRPRTLRGFQTYREMFIFLRKKLIESSFFDVSNVSCIGRPNGTVSTQTSYDPIRRSISILKANAALNGKSISISPHYAQKLATANAMNNKYTKDTSIANLRTFWKGKMKDVQPEEGGELIKRPFNCVYLPSFISSSDLVQQLITQLKHLPLRRKSNDMYKFYQSDELPATGASQELRQLFLGEVRDWLTSITGIPLDERVTLSCSVYQHTDVLLCHDDELERRRIAFILYLTEDDWKEQDGGSLDLFSVDGSGRPNVVVKSLYPKFNHFAFFEVSPVSFHQVAEVLSRKKIRLSVNGWFYGPNIKRPKVTVPPKMFFHPGFIEESLFYEWVNPLYLAESTQASIRKQFLADSEILLDDFFQEDKFASLCEALKKGSYHWVGPPNRAHYQVLAEGSARDSAVIQECLRLLRSEAMFLILSQLTGLTLHSLARASEEGKEDEEESEDGSEDEDMEKEGPEAQEDVTELTLNRLIAERKRVKASSKHIIEGGNNLDRLNKKWVFDTGFVMQATGNNKKSSKEGVMTGSVRRVTHGSYTIIRDDDFDSGKRSSSKKSSSSDSDSYVLEGFLFGNVPKDWRDSYGGHITYLAKNEQEDLLSVTPKSNSLALVYRDSHTFSFLKHVNCSSMRGGPKGALYDCIALQYKGN